VAVGKAQEIRIEEAIMKNRYYNRKAQSSLEYTMVAAFLVAALLTMQIYIKRSIQGRLKAAADEIGEQYSATTSSSLYMQIISDPSPYDNVQQIRVTGTPKFVEHDGKQYEITEIKRHEEIQITTPTGGSLFVVPSSYEQTGKLSEEELFPPE
jgi:uncharacterized protein (UPF0333 family)